MSLQVSLWFHGRVDISEAVSGNILMLFRKHFHLEEDLFLPEEQYKCRPSRFLLTECENSFPSFSAEIKWLAVKWCKDDDHDRLLSSSCTRNSMQSIFSHIPVQSQPAAFAISTFKLFSPRVKRQSAFQVNPNNFERRLYVATLRFDSIRLLGIADDDLSSTRTTKVARYIPTNEAQGFVLLPLREWEYVVCLYLIVYITLLEIN